MSTAALREPVPRMTEVEIADDELYEIVDGNRVRQSPMALYSVLIGNILFSEPAEAEAAS